MLTGIEALVAAIKVARLARSHATDSATSASLPAYSESDDPLGVAPWSAVKRLLPDVSLATDARASRASDVLVLPKPRPDGLNDEVEAAQVFEMLFQRAAHDPLRFGRYVVLGLLGQGAMGVVLQAYDRELDRAVALKVLHRGLGERHTKRLRREAQAMAKLSHPNVVQVYEVGEVEGQTFVAMELVKGKTLREWMQQRPRPGWRECVELFVQVGAGLAAAHECGLVHRDFKPGNAIVDDKGRARVLDFGLARQDDEADEVSSEWLEKARTDSHAVVSLETSLTATGTVLGTPAYMPPEQMDGLEADARSDQFSFCVSLYEAVYGERPYQGGSMDAIMMSVRTGSVRLTPKGSGVPVALRRALLRGLSVEPAQRWPSMAALLEELRRLVIPRRRRWMALGVSVGLVAVGGGVGVTQALKWLNRCTGAHKELEEVWDEERSQEVKAAILGTELPYATGTWERVKLRLDDYASAWVSEHSETCEATHVRSEQSEEDMSLRMGCLRERKQHLQATVNELAQANATVVQNAVQAATGLPELDRCADVEALRAEVPPPEDRVIADQVDKLDELLVEVKAKEKAGKYKEGLKLADEVVEKGEALGYKPLMARAWSQQGLLRELTGDYKGATTALRHAYHTAVAQRMAAETADVSALLMYTLGYKLARHEEAGDWAEHAEPHSLAARTDDALATYHNSAGMVAESQGKYDEARVHHEQALAIRKKLLGSDHADVAKSLGNLANVAYMRGKYEEARIHYERALAILEEALGPDHPDVAKALCNLGSVAHAQGKYDEARAHYERALAIWEEALGPEHPDVAKALNNLGGLALSQGESDVARAHYERVLAIREKALGTEHPAVATALINLGGLAYVHGRYDEARAHNERALALLEKALGPEHPDVARALGNLSNVALKQGKSEEARAHSERALAIKEKALGSEHPDVAKALDNLGRVEQSLGKYDEARAHSERALALLEKALGPEHQNVTVSLQSLGELAESLGKYDEARQLYERWLAINDTTLKPDHPNVALSLTGLGNVAYSQGKYEDARSFHERALVIWEKVLGPNDSTVAESLVGIGAALFALGEPTDALVPLERALAICVAREIDPTLLTKTRFALARALWTAPVSEGRDRARARILAEQARDTYGAAVKTKKAELVEVKAWLTKHRLP